MISPPPPSFPAVKVGVQRSDERNDRRRSIISPLLLHPGCKGSWCFYAQMYYYIGQSLVTHTHMITELLGTEKLWGSICYCWGAGEQWSEEGSLAGKEKNQMILHLDITKLRLLLVLHWMILFGRWWQIIWSVSLQSWGRWCLQSWIITTTSRRYAASTKHLVCQNWVSRTGHFHVWSWGGFSISQESYLTESSPFSRVYLVRAWSNW